MVVGIGAGLGSAVLTILVYSFEDLFQKLPIHWMWWPALGGLAVGVGGLVDPRVLGVGYGVIHDLLLGQGVGALLLSLLIVKALVWAIALGSGTSGGVLAPLLMIGGALGALESHWLALGDPRLWALVDMAAMMGGTMRSPLTAMIFALELTHDLNALPALLVGCVAAHTVTVLLMRRSILTEKVARRGYHLTREYSVDPFTLVRVGEIMDTDRLTIPATMHVAELSERIARRPGRDAPPSVADCRRAGSLGGDYYARRPVPRARARSQRQAQRVRGGQREPAGDLPGCAGRRRADNDATQ